MMNDHNSHFLNSTKFIFKGSVTIVCIKVKYTKERKHGEEKLPTLQKALKRHTVEFMESIFPDAHEKCNENLGIWKCENI